MARVALALAVTAAYVASVAGWGRAVLRASRVSGVPWGLAAVLGLAAWICLGGLLNLLGIALAPVLDGLVVLGWALLAVDAWRSRGTRSHRPGAMTLAWLVPTLAVASFVAATQVPPEAYNFHDDFITYFVQPARMLATGSVFGSPVSSIGRASLGAQPFLLGFAVAHLPIACVNAVDALFCLVLCPVALGSHAASRRLGAGPTLLAMALLVAINPQYVNVTSLYSGAAIVVALVLLGAYVDPFEATGRGRLRAALPFALLYAALAALKHTLVFFVALHFLGWTAAAMSRRSPREVVRSAAVIVAASALALAPWLGIYAPHYRHAAMDRSGGVLRFATPEIPNPFDLAPLPYGATFLAYTLVILLVAAMGVWAILRSRARPGERSSASVALVGGCAATVATYVAFLLVVIRMLGVEHGLRYFCPIAIGAAPALVLLGWEVLGAAGVRATEVAIERDGRPPRARAALAAGIAVCVALFVPSLAARLDEAASSGSILAFDRAATSAPYLAYNREVLDDGDRPRAIQARIPVGEPFLAWTVTPFQLDFRRNRVLEADLVGLANPWGPLPDVEYVMWDYAGFAVRSARACQAMTTSGNAADESAGHGCLEWLRRMNAAARRAEILYDDGRTVLLRVPPDALRAPPPVAGESAG